MGFPSSPLFQSIDELPYFDGLNKEYVERFGTTVQLTIFDKSASTIDPIYNEPTATVERVATIPAFVVELIPIDSPEAREEGFRIEKDTTVHFARIHLEEAKDQNGVLLGISDVPIGSIIEVYGSKWDVINSQRGAFINQINKWMRVECSVKRRSEFIPERRTLP